jgi:hypothetical protein
VVVKSRSYWVILSVLILALVLLLLQLVVPPFLERSAVDLIHSAGGRVEIAYRGPEWARKMLDRWCPESMRFGFVDRVFLVAQNPQELTDLQAATILGNLHRFPKLDCLVLRGRAINDDGLQSLQGLQNLETLGLIDTSITDDGMISLHGLKRLNYLSLNGARITDRAIDTLVELPALEVLHLDNTGITDAGLDKLARLKSLRELSISQTDTSDAAIDRLHDAIPDVQITDD